MSLLILVAVSAGAFLLSAAIGALLVRFAGGTRLIDVPNARSSHTTPTPRGGGLGIVAGTLVGLLVVGAVGVPLPMDSVWVVVGGGAVIAGISFIDDLWGVPPLIRLPVHLAVAIATVAVVGGVGHVTLPWIGGVDLGVAGPVLTGFWIAGIINAFNFMDGIDGLAASQGVVASGFWIALGALLGWPFLVAAGAVLGASCLGFLVHNWPPARLFMGDVGSAFLGFMLGVLPVVAAQRDATVGLIGVILVWPFVFDTTLTLVRRIQRRENLTVAHRTHLYQRLVATGLSHGWVMRLYVLLAVMAGLAGLALGFGLSGHNALAAVYLLGAPALLLELVSYREGRAKTSHGESGQS